MRRAGGGGGRGEWFRSGGTRTQEVVRELEIPADVGFAAGGARRQLVVAGSRPVTQDTNGILQTEAQLNTQPSSRVSQRGSKAIERNSRACVFFLFQLGRAAETSEKVVFARLPRIPLITATSG